MFNQFNRHIVNLAAKILVKLTKIIPVYGKRFSKTK
jgi:hypothetical protein